MKIKLIKQGKLAILPAGIVEDVELFYFNNQKWVLCKGKLTAFNNAPELVQRMVHEAFENDSKRQLASGEISKEKYETYFDAWYHRQVGYFGDDPSEMDMPFRKGKQNEE